MKKDVLVLFSAGRDSVLSTSYLVESGYSVKLITFENGVGIASEFAGHTADRLIQRYGNSKVQFLGVKNTYAYWREFFLPYLNLTPSEVKLEFGELTASQFHCLTCRVSMYIWSIIYAKQHCISYIGDGARKNQYFVIELPIFIDRVTNLFEEFEIELKLPVWDLQSDDKRKNELLARGFVPKTLEPQCLIGVPIPNETEPNVEIQNAVVNYYNKIIEPRAKKLIKEGIDSGIQLGGKLI